MIELILVFIALAANADGQSTGSASVMGEMEPDTEASAAMNTAPASKFEAEDQTPSGKFTTATEIKPILSMTKANWVAVREFNGNDLLYVTHLMSWRCGMHEMRYAINDGPMMIWPLPPCLIDTNAPNAIRTEDGLPYESFELGSVQSVSVELLFDDLSTDAARFERKEILMP